MLFVTIKLGYSTTPENKPTESKAEPEKKPQVDVAEQENTEPDDKKKQNFLETVKVLTTLQIEEKIRHNHLCW